MKIGGNKVLDGSNLIYCALPDFFTLFFEICCGYWDLLDHKQLSSSFYIVIILFIIVRFVKRLRCNISMRQLSSLRVTDLWNSLPNSIVDAPSMNALKN
jgi:hypothetical protein